MSINGRYVRIATKFWSDEKIINLSGTGKLLFLYFLSCPHSNMAGYYRLPKPYMKADLQLSDEQLSKGFSELLDKGLIYYCHESSVILIPNYYKYNSIQNVNQAKGAAQRTCELPRNSLVEKYSESIKHYADKYQKELLKGLCKGLGKQSNQQFGNTESESDTESDTETEVYCPAEKDQQDDLPYQKIIDYLNKKAGRDFKANTDQTQKHINARYDEGYNFKDFVEVIDKKTADWRGDPEMEKYLRPSTLFRPTKFEEYLNEPWPKDYDHEPNNSKSTVKELEAAGWN